MVGIVAGANETQFFAGKSHEQYTAFALALGGD